MQPIYISGRVVHGDRYGQRLGFPTANLDRRMFARQRAKIRLGIYAGYAFVPFRPRRAGADKSGRDKFFAGARNGQRHKAAIVIGPLDKSGLPKLEAHLIGFSGDLYGKKMVLILRQFLRPFKIFNAAALLRKQIRADIAAARRLRLP